MSWKILNAWRGRNRIATDGGVENEADRIAASWVAHLDRHGGNEDQHPKLKTWLEADPRNRGAFVRASAAWLLLESNPGLLDVSPSNVDRGSPNLAGPNIVGRRAVMGGLSAAALILTTVALVGRPTKTMAYSTTVGEIRRYNLPDGSTMTLDTDSRVETVIESSRREIKIIAGGAFFEVKPNSTASFLVTDAEFRVQASAASFFISSAPEHRLFVTSGHVDLGRISQRNSDAYRLERGKLASIGRDGTTRVSKFSDDLIARNLAWREGGVSLDGETVSEATQIFNRYNRRQISVSDVALANEEIVGWFEIDQPQTFAQAVAAAFNCEILDRGNLIQIVPRKKM